ncbi:MAG TPA: PilW family protein [Dissulfurispiraceae bacterium]|nr:PilW family protein [Dissulfurispiraceae bacterium]
MNHRKTRNFSFNERGFSLIELLVVMAILVFAIAVSASMFTSILGQSKQQGRIAETQLENLPGLEMLRSDIEHAGYGLPWSVPSVSGIVYSEAQVNPAADPANNFNEVNAPWGGVPRAFSGDQVGVNVLGSSYFVIRAANVAMNDQSQRWTMVSNKPVQGTIDGLTGLGSDRPQIGQGVIVLEMRSAETFRQLHMYGTAFSIGYTEPLNTNFSPPPMEHPGDATEPAQSYMVYGIDNASPVRMPFNRADYFISLNSIPSTCAAGTGVLTKYTVNHNGGSLTAFPVIDCVADFQVSFGLDTNTDNVIDQWLASLPAATYGPEQIRKMVKEVRVYILLHEGRMDPSFTFSDFTGGGTSVRVGDTYGGRNFDLAAIANFQNYRWKVITMVVTPKNLQ